ncbi:MAG: methylmalonyl Co-A mutase-associated GTPase MeaB [Sideroxyarcus sp.]|nr:methylmalonyl Co-A mutase-associated GTPase MeaB [Sideroxyarcus sp.]
MLSLDLPEQDAALVTGVLGRQRRALAKAITLIESSRADHQARAHKVLEALLPSTGKAIRIGISGVPGVGKSTVIEALGLYLIEQGHRVAVLAIDPSSSISGGSILGDKTRMELLSQRDEAFIRPSPASGALGGVAHRTREAMLLCEAAGFDVVIVETVGVGQSETAVAGMTDVFVLLQLPNAGDDLQGIKKGIVELADIVVFNKADIDPRAAEVACGQMRSALHMLRPLSTHWQIPVLKISAAKKEGLTEFWQAIEKYRHTMQAAGEFNSKRKHQALAWMWDMIETGLHQQFREHPIIKRELSQVADGVSQGRITPAAGAQLLLSYLK